MRVVAGSARGRPLRAPDGRGTRPTGDRVREAVFDMLTSMGEITDATVVDLFAGSGALGIEALSRGAAAATLVDRDRGALAAIRHNLTVLGDGAEATVVRADAVDWVRARPGRVADLVFADPPYGWDGWPDLLEALWSRCGLVVAETAPGWEPPPGWDPVRVRRYGSTLVTLLRPAPIAPDASNPPPAHEHSRGWM